MRGVVDELCLETLKPFLLADVGDLKDRVQWLAVGVENQRDALEDEHLVSVGVDIATFQVIAAQLPRQHPLREDSISLRVVWMNDVSNIAGQKTVFPVAGDLSERSVDAQPAALGRHKRHADGRVIERASKSLLT